MLHASLYIGCCSELKRSNSFIWKTGHTKCTLQERFVKVGHDVGVSQEEQLPNNSVQEKLTSESQMRPFSQPGVGKIWQKHVMFCVYCLHKIETRKQSPREQCGFKRSTASLGQRAVQQEECFQGEKQVKSENWEEKSHNLKLMFRITAKIPLFLFELLLWANVLYNEEKQWNRIIFLSLKSPDQWEE